MSEKKATRAAYGEAIVELAAENDKIVVLDADLSHNQTEVRPFSPVLWLMKSVVQMQSNSYDMFGSKPIVQDVLQRAAC